MVEVQKRCSVWAPSILKHSDLLEAALGGDRYPLPTGGSDVISYDTPIAEYHTIRPDEISSKTLFGKMVRHDPRRISAGVGYLEHNVNRLIVEVPMIRDVGSQRERWDGRTSCSIT